MFSPRRTALFAEIKILLLGISEHLCPCRNDYFKTSKISSDPQWISVATAMDLQLPRAIKRNFEALHVSHSHTWPDGSDFTSDREMPPPPPPRNMLDCHFNVFLRRGRNKSERRMTFVRGKGGGGGGGGINVPRVRRPRRPTLCSRASQSRGMVASAKLRSTLLVNYEEGEKEGLCEEAKKFNAPHHVWEMICAECSAGEFHSPRTIPSKLNAYCECEQQTL